MLETEGEVDEEVKGSGGRVIDGEGFAVEERPVGVGGASEGEVGGSGGRGIEEGPEGFEGEERRAGRRGWRQEVLFDVSGLVGIWVGEDAAFFAVWGVVCWER